ncbi:disulfide bond formation protein DsbA [Nocardiopsis gilva YIM 90087]|uniref:Disulfide bond formation protein DsbA n=1 Tax=Nocardiopsis gilva YIM 90087 TaxID=1235441 RepID=A0A223S6U0_9ACTN|nr:DsbA family protein [Nocardiopsis gilva]ASU83834.1 disulfide bond formation protein DsbA [Nocardiopsis gilva YIM 90087]
MTRSYIADIWFDPSCPYSRLTARWLVEVARVRPVEVRWRVMSLSVLNEGRDDDPEGDPEGYLWIPARICAAVQERHGHAALGRFYAALWADRERGEGDWIGDIEQALADADLPRELARVGMSEEYDDALRASHAAGVGLVGDHVGTPVIAATSADGERVAFFGPVISAVPTGEQAARLWDATLVVAATPGFHELKGPPPREPAA